MKKPSVLGRDILSIRNFLYFIILWNYCLKDEIASFSGGSYTPMQILTIRLLLGMESFLSRPFMFPFSFLFICIYVISCLVVGFVCSSLPLYRVFCG